ncbi:MAG: phosphoribosylaminoimidazolesuccinocarboxamide synthase [Pelagibacteraceae bacterium]|nr:phosphoribosylaminoimidazolesuccinocarboxamide synthase [Pelagibacteraceae bacterium]
MIYEKNSKEVQAYYKNDATAFNNLKKGSIKDKGKINNTICCHLYEILNNCDIPTHFIKKIDKNTQLLEKVEIVPIEVLVRNYFAGSLSKKFGIKEGEKLPDTLIEYCLKSDELGDPHISSDHILTMELCSEETLELIDEYSLRINDILRSVFYVAGLNLVDFKLEFGFSKKDKSLVLADEISPDTCRLWDIKSNEKLDKDRFRRDLGKVEEAYLEVMTRLGLKL